MRPWLQHMLVVTFGLLVGFYLITVIEVIQSGALLPIFLKRWLGLSPPYETDPMKIIGLDPHSSTHNFVFVGVMTAQKFLNTRAVAVDRTWKKSIPGRVAFFSSEDSSSDSSLPLVHLEGVDDSYPPQKKSFMMLRYMWKNYGDYFEWFVRADDDVYIRGDKLNRFLRSLNSSKPHYIGQAGIGTHEEIGKLSLQNDENFCMGGPGVIISRETLRLIAPHIEYCLKNMYSTHEDVEVGRCIKTFVGISCTWSYEMQKIMYHDFSGDSAFIHSLKSEEVHRAITLHPVKQHQHFYTLHNYLMGLKMQELNNLALRIHQELYTATKHLGTLISRFTSINQQYRSGNTSVLGLPASLHKFVPLKESEVSTWDFISKTESSHRHSNPRRKMQSNIAEGLQDVIRELVVEFNKVSQKRGRVIEFRDVLYGFQLVHPQYGQDLILDLLFDYKKYRGKKMTIPVRKHVYLHRPFTKPRIRELNDGSILLPPNTMTLPSLFRKAEKPTILPPKTIHFILPLSGRIEEFRRFLDNYEKMCLQKEEMVSLVVVVFKDEMGKTKEAITEMTNSLRHRYPKAFFRVLEPHGSFSRAKALDIGSFYSPADALLFFVDVDILFTSGSLQRIRMNTVSRKQAYFPIVYSEFDPSMTSEEKDKLCIDENRGYWRNFGYGIVSIYKKDLKQVGGLDISIEGWGKEDVDLYEKVLRSKIRVFRAPDVGLVHVFHPIHCHLTMDDRQKEMCMKTRASTYVSVQQAAHLFLDNETIRRTRGPWR